MPPFWGDANGSGTERQIFQMILAGDVDLETAPWPSVSAAAKDLVLRLLRMDPAARCVRRRGALVATVAILLSGRVVNLRTVVGR